MTTSPWRTVAKRLEKFGARVHEQFGVVGDETAAERAALEQSLRGFVTVIEDAFAVAGSTFTDPALRRDAMKVAESVREALVATLGQHRHDDGHRKTLGDGHDGHARPGRRAVDGARAPQRTRAAAPARRHTSTRTSGSATKRSN